MADDDTTALDELVALAENLPGQFRPEFELGYWAGVSGAESWYVRFEGDIEDTEFTVLGFTAAEALQKAAAEAQRRRDALKR